MTAASVKSRVYGSFYGLAMGDAVGFPALYHRTLPLGWKRGMMWEFNKQADAQRVNKFSLPFTLGSPESDLYLCGTDDTEYAAISALILAESGDDPSSEQLFAGWKAHVTDREQEVWSGVAERASIENAKKGLTPPATGNDNPHHFDDGAVARSVPFGWKFKGDTQKAAEAAGLMASITNAEDGVYAAMAMAASIAAAVDGASASESLDAGMAHIPQDSWLARKTAQAKKILRDAGSGFAALPAWNHHVVNGIYNYGNVAPETLAVAYAIIEACEGRLQEGLQLAALVPKQADSMPAMVGALSGALQGIEAVPASWQDSLGQLKGICLPHIKGYGLKEIADRLIG